MSKAKKEQQYYNGIQIDSIEEQMAVMYFEELIEAGYVKSIERAETFLLSEKVQNKYTQLVEMKTKIKQVEKNQVLLEEHVYTPEFKVNWTEKALYILMTNMGQYNTKITQPFMGNYSDLDNLTSYIEVKPNFDHHNMTRLFKINQKWMYQEHSKFVNLVQPHKLFEETFTPTAYLKTATGKQRVIHWKVRTLEEYLDTLTNQ